MKYYLNLCRRVLYWVLPVVILYVVFQNIDLQQFQKNINQSSMLLISLGIICFPTAALIGALRWYVLLGQYLKTDISLGYSLRHYWIGLALGVFITGSLGEDGYRVVVIGRRLGHYMTSLAVIMVEKFMALLTLLSLIIVLYPFMPFVRFSPLLGNIFRLVCLLFLVILLLTGSLVLVERTNLIKSLLNKVEERIFVIFQTAARKAGLNQEEQSIRIGLWKMLRPLTVPKYLLLVVGLSFAIQFVSAVGFQIFFLAIDYDLPFIVNLFARPIIYFIFMLPISFGSLGIREASFIILYGLFGVPAETALLVSFLGLSGRLLNIAIGALLIFLQRYQRELCEKTITTQT